MVSTYVIRMYEQYNQVDKKTLSVGVVMLKKKNAGIAFAAGMLLFGATAFATGTNTWEPYQDTDAMISAMAKYGSNEEMAVVGYTNGNVYLSFNADQSQPTWTRLDSSYYTNLPNLQVASIAISPRDNRSIYIGFVGRHYPNKLWKTSNGGQSFVDLGFGYAEIRSISVGPNGRNVYVVTESGVVVSEDYGTNWTTGQVADEFGVPMPQGSRVSAVATHSRFPNLTVVGGTNGEVFYKNGNSSWSRLDDATYPGAVSLPNRIVNKIEITKAFEMELLVALGDISVSDRQNLWQGAVSTSGFFWTNKHIDNLPGGNMYGFYTNPGVSNAYHAANVFVAAYKETDTWLLSKLGLSVLYADGDNGQVYNNNIKPNLKVVNNGNQSVSLKDLTIRYWYTIDGVKAQTFSVDWAQVGSGNVTGSFTSVSGKPNADYYLAIGFTTGAGNLAIGSSTELKTRFNKTDWTNYNETNDYSYADFGGYTKAPKVGLYYKGKLVWGVEP